MSIKEFILDKKMYFIAHIASLILLQILLATMGINRSGIIFVMIFMIFCHVLYLTHEYFRRFRFYKNINDQLEGLDRKYLISEFIERPNFYEGETLENIVSDACKSMNDEINVYKSQWTDYRDYIESWVHEVKTPLSASYLMLENKQANLEENLYLELERIEGYVEQALYYARSNHVEKDYIIKPYPLDELVKDAVRKHRKLLIEAKCDLKIDLQSTIYTDGKWLTFVLSQIIINAIKYSNMSMKLSFTEKVNKDFITLNICDNGIGIKKDEIDDVFVKGFVGSNGRHENKSTGIGLYLCKKLCHKLGLAISIKSDQGTCVSIHFPVSTTIG
ncbi:HAMP domain-containing histidine kinase [Acidaminobacter sp. JC074]|uniref:sensor histidine kinase n=1 Tax=Acidaminobacter sp. JC074 TaxID=2530199 RepID=UPI001F10FF46|nr:sensor histidine kinase [Acidaminobacter sp. JC074]MCH4889793.1 HAMP domain-containing histidine kinase [Acidaminobacter sp. JC074]